MHPMTRSPQTSVGGAIAALGVLFAFILPSLGVEVSDGKADELAGAVATLVGIIWTAIAARDHNVTSERAGATKK